MQPNNFSDWVDVAKDRQADAKALLTRPQSTGPVYLAGYALEASLKALIITQGGKPPTKGTGGHNLKNLLNQTGLKPSDIINIGTGEQSFFFENWTTDLRYETSLDELQGFNCQSLVNAAGHLAQRIQRLVWRKKRGR